MTQRTRFVYPFSAIVGQGSMKKALLLNAVNPKIGGVLIRGHKGTAKSVAVRALAQLLPVIEVVPGCPFRCDPASPETLCDSCASRMADGEKLGSGLKQVPVVDLPIGATRRTGLWGHWISSRPSRAARSTSNRDSSPLPTAVFCTSMK